MSQSSPLTDSLWFWFALFTFVGLSTVLITGGKFKDRQANIERKGQARLSVGAGLKITEDGTGRKTAENVPEYSRPGMTKISLKALTITIGSVLAFSLAMLARERVLLAKQLTLDSSRHDANNE